MMTFHESYGDLPKRTLNLIRKFNVSPADYDDILFQFGVSWNEAGTFSSQLWESIDTMIVSNSDTGMYRPCFF